VHDVAFAGLDGALAASSSTIMPITAPFALWRIRAASRPTVSDVPPAPGLSCTSASTIGFLAFFDSSMARSAAASGSSSSPAKPSPAP
jgi:hypothetical protein